MEFAAFLRRLSFAAGALAELRPCLGPMYPWLAAVHHRRQAAPPLCLRLLLEWLSERVFKHKRLDSVQVHFQEVGLAFLTDAKAEDGKVFVGGWECIGGVGTGEARWFAVEVTEGWAP